MTYRTTQVALSKLSDIADNHQKRYQDGKDSKDRQHSARRKTNTANADRDAYERITPEYTVDKFVAHVETGGNIGFVVRW